MISAFVDALEVDRGDPEVAVAQLPLDDDEWYSFVGLQGIDNAEIIEAVHARRAPMIPVSASLRP